MIHSDRLSAFDCIVSHVPFKGIYLNEINSFWLEKAQDIVPVCPFKKINQRTLQMKKLSPIKLEIIVRGYLAGSMQRAYKNGERQFCNHLLEHDIPSFGKLKEVLVTPTTKASIFNHDENITPTNIIKKNICTTEQWDTICEIALKLFSFGSKIYEQKGWILVDTKYEFGLDERNQIFVMDEIHTPDSSRLWLKASYTNRLSKKLPPEMFDKEIIRNYLIEQAFVGKGPAPHIPSKKLLSLSQTYLDVAENLLDKTLKYEDSTEIFNSLI